MYCPNCGTQLENGQNFCPNCGTNLAASAQQPVQQPAQPYYGQSAQQPAQPYYGQPAQPPVYGVQPAPKKKSALPIVLGILIGVVAAVGICLAVMLMQKNKPAVPTGTPDVSDTAAGETTAVPTDTDAATGETAAPADTTAATGETAAPDDGPAGTTAAPDTTAEPQTPGATLDALWDKLSGCWSTESDDNTFVMFSRENGQLRFVYGIWYSDILIDATATGKWSSEPDSPIVSVHIYSPAIDTEGYYSEEMDIDLQIDLTEYENGRISWFLGREWESGTYAGATMEEAQPDIW